MPKRPAMERKVCVRPAPAGGWDVYDLHTKEIAVFDGRILCSLYPEEAFEIAAHLNVNRHTFAEERLTTKNGTRHHRRRQIPWSV